MAINYLEIKKGNKFWRYDDSQNRIKEVEVIERLGDNPNFNSDTTVLLVSQRESNQNSPLVLSTQHPQDLFYSIEALMDKYFIVHHSIINK